MLGRLYQRRRGNYSFMASFSIFFLNRSKESLEENWRHQYTSSSSASSSFGVDLLWHSFWRRLLQIAVERHLTKKLGRGYHTNPSDGTLTYSFRITNEILQN